LRGDNEETMSIYDTCAAAHEDDPKLLLKCVANWVETVASNSTSTTQGVAMTQEIKSWLLVLAGAMVFFMQVKMNVCRVCERMRES
jgi:hypothetical protein